MRENKRWRRTTAVACAVALLAAACGNGDDPGTDPGTDPTTPTDGIAFDVGVTEEPCPNAVHDDTGCIYLGNIQDLTGVFQVVGTQWQEAQRAFWAAINEAGGIGGFEIDVDTYLRDNAYDVTQHATAYSEIRDSVLMLGASLGTSHTEGILQDMIDDNMLAIPATAWSGWDFIDNVVAIVGSYCMMSVVHLDWANAQLPVENVMGVGFPGDYGGDVVAGAQRWAEEAGANFLGVVETGPTAAIGSQDAAIGAILNSDPRPDVVVLGVTPQETAEIVGGALSQGFQGRFLGAIPTWAAPLAGTAAMPALETAYTHVSAIGLWDADTPGHEAMREALGGNPPGNEFYTLGWASGYGIKAILEAAVANGDLTRQGLIDVLEGLTVDFQGMAPSTTYGTDINERLQTQMFINQPSSDAALGLVTVDSAATGPVAESITFDGPCVGSG